MTNAKIAKSSMAGRNGTPGRSRTLLTVLGVVLVGALVATALARNDRHRGVGLPGHRASHYANRKTDISVFTHRPRGLARTAGTSSIQPPPGAILAVISGRTEVYALHAGSSQDCVMRLEAQSAGGSACGGTSKVEREGLVAISGEGVGAKGPGSPPAVQVTLLVPDGVKKIVIVDRDGSSHDIPVINNVAEDEDVNTGLVSYTLSSGVTQTTDVAEVVDKLPRQPGSPGTHQ